MSEIVLDGVSKVYEGGVEAVRGVNLTIASGEFIVLVGPSGCGKSTTLRMIAGLEEISGGTISIAGRVINDVAPKDRDIAMVFQSYALYPHMSVRQNMAFALKLRGTPKDEIERRVSDAARILGLEPYLDRKPGALSGGQRQRVALGRAIVREPRAFLFDEPLSNLDAKLRVTTRSELKTLHQRLRTTTVYVTHDQEEAMTLGDRIVVMADGEVQQVGTPFEVFGSPANRFVAGFIGTPPTNFLEGTVTREGGRVVFTENGESGDRVSLETPDPATFGWAFDDDQPATLGVRPQGVELVQGDAGLDPRREIRLAVDLVEPLGEQMDVHGSTAGGHRLVFRVRSSGEIRVGSTARFAVHTEQLHIFEPGEYGPCLTREAPDRAEALQASPQA